MKLHRNGVFAKILGRKDDFLETQAGGLFPSAQAIAIASSQSFAEKFNIVRRINLDDWDFFVTVATVFIGLTRLNEVRIRQSRRDDLAETVARALCEWDAGAANGFEDCKKFFEAEYDSRVKAGMNPEFVAVDSVGLWIVWNLLKRAPESDEECKLVRAVGLTVVQIAFNWWKR